VQTGRWLRLQSYQFPGVQITYTTGVEKTQSETSSTSLSQLTINSLATKLEVEGQGGSVFSLGRETSHEVARETIQSLTAELAYSAEKSVEQTFPSAGQLWQWVWTLQQVDCQRVTLRTNVLRLTPSSGLPPCCMPCCEVDISRPRGRCRAGSAPLCMSNGSHLSNNDGDDGADSAGGSSLVVAGAQGSSATESSNARQVRSRSDSRDSSPLRSRPRASLNSFVARTNLWESVPVIFVIATGLLARGSSLLRRQQGKHVPSALL